MRIDVQPCRPVRTAINGIFRHAVICLLYSLLTEREGNLTSRLEIIREQLPHDLAQQK